MTELPISLAANPRLGDWLRIDPDGYVEVRSGKVELGQGVVTALAQIAAEELDVDLARVRMTAVDTEISPDEGYTAGSLSIQNSGAALRLVCAEGRDIYLSTAADKMAVPVEDLSVEDGTITGPHGPLTSYWELADDHLLDQDATGTAAPKAESAHRIVGTDAARIDLPDKLLGRPRYVHDLAPDGLVYGRVVRPPARGATLRAIDPASTEALPGVLAVVREGGFLGVVADREEVAIRAADRLRAEAVWDEQPTLPDENDLAAYLTSAPADSTVLAEHGKPAEAALIARHHEATFDRPYLAHASIGPSSATAVLDGQRLIVWSHSQGVHILRRELATALNLPTHAVTVRHREGAGCYGHNGADDAAMDAALLATHLPGRPVQVVWSRADELSWAPFGPAAVVRITADTAEDGTVLNWRHEIWGTGHVSRPGATPTPFLASAHRDGTPMRTGPEVPLDRGGGAGRNAVPGYAFPHHRVINNDLRDLPLRTSSMRSLGALVNVFALESTMDDLAEAAGRDPVEYRLAQLTDPRGRAVLERVAELANWGADTPESIGRGIAYARYKNSSAYCAVIAEVEAIETVRVRRLTLAVDAGLVINPDGARNQIEGGAIQATSWATKERVRFDRHGVTSDNWETYPILRFSEVPSVDVELLPGNGNPSLGVGETAQGPTVAAIANAVHAALGVRVRSLPLSAEHIIAAMPD